MAIAITNEAIRIIDGAPKHGAVEPTAYSAALPKEAAGLAAVILSPAIMRIVEAFRKADGEAMRGQAWSKGVANLAAGCGFLAAVLGGIVLYLGSNALTQVLGVAQIAFLAISLLGSLVLRWFQFFRTWRTARGAAEFNRVKVYSEIVRSQRESEDRLLTALRLECFRRHLLDDQQEFFVKRGREHRSTVRFWTTLRVVALVLIIAACLPLLARWRPDFIGRIISPTWIVGVGAHSAYALAGLVGAALQGLLAALATISLAERNADKYEAMVKRLEFRGNELEAARADAANGRGNEVVAFTERVANDLMLEVYDWGVWHEAFSARAAKLPAHAPKVDPDVS